MTFQDVLNQTVAHWCPYKIGEVCEFQEPHSVDGQYQACRHFEHCNVQRLENSVKENEMSEWLELLFDALTHGSSSNESMLRWVHEAIKERNNLLQKLSYQLDAHEALISTNANLRHVEKMQHARIKQLEQQIHDEGAGRA